MIFAAPPQANESYTEYRDRIRAFYGDSTPSNLVLGDVAVAVAAPIGRMRDGELVKCYWCQAKATNDRNGIPQCKACVERYKKNDQS